MMIVWWSSAGVVMGSRGARFVVGSVFLSGLHLWPRKCWGLGLDDDEIGGFLNSNYAYNAVFTTAPEESLGDVLLHDSRF
jgi:hypothetical protein